MLEQNVKESFSKTLEKNKQNKTKLIAEESPKEILQIDKTLLSEGNLNQNNELSINYSEEEGIKEFLMKNHSDFKLEELEINSYNKDEIRDYVNNQLDLSHLDSLPIVNYNHSESLKTILVVTHSGFISELINVIRKLKNLKSVTKNETHNTGVHVIRIYCINCGGKCTGNCDESKFRIEFDFVLINDTSHLSILKSEYSTCKNYFK